MRLYDTSELTNSAKAANIIQRSFSANLMRIEPNGQSPILALSGMAEVRKIYSIVHSYYVKQMIFPSVTLGAAAGTGTTLTVVDSSELKVGSMLIGFQVSAGSWTAPEVVMVTAITNNTTIEVLRDTGGLGSPVNFANGTVLQEIGNAYEEGSAAPTARAIGTEEHINRTQIFRNTWDLTKTAGAVSLEPNFTQEAENKEDAMFFHGNSIEWSTLFGRGGTRTVNGRPHRTFDGIEKIVTDFAPGNVVAAGATTTFKQLESYLHPTLDNRVRGRGYGPKTLYVGSEAREVINEIGRASGYYELTPDSTIFGMEFEHFRTSRGKWEIIEHPLLNTNDVTKKMAIVADMAGFDFHWLRETTHEDINLSGADATSGVYTSELTTEVQNPLGWGIVYNLTAGA